MKKWISVCAVAVLGLGLTACGNSSQPSKTSSSKAASSSSAVMQHHRDRELQKYNDAEYAMAAYLKLAKQSAQQVAENSDGMNWQAQGQRYEIDFGGHPTYMTVSKKSVQVTYDTVDGDQMGSQNGHKIYTKQQLVKILKGQKATIDNLLKTPSQAQSSSESSSDSENAANQTSQDASSKTGKVMIHGHSFHYQDFHGTRILVGDHGEGEAGEWAANDPEVQGNSQVESQLSSLYGNDK